MVTTFWGWHSFTPTWDSERTVDNYVTLTLIHTYLRLCQDSRQLCDTHTYSHLPETVWGQLMTMWHWHLFTPTWDWRGSWWLCEADIHSSSKNIWTRPSSAHCASTSLFGWNKETTLHVTLVQQRNKCTLVLKQSWTTALYRSICESFKQQI